MIRFNGFECDTVEEAIALSKALRNEWVEWSGGERPVDSDVIVHYRMRDREEVVGRGVKAGHLRWNHTGLSSDIVAYWVVEK